MRTMALWPKHLLSQVMSPTWWSHFSRFWGYCFVLPGLECRDSQRPWRQQCGVSRCWNWRRAHQKYACFVNANTGERSWSQSEANLSLQWRRFVSRCTVNFSKHEQPAAWLSRKRDSKSKCLHWSKVQELQNESSCMDDSRKFKDVESARSGQEFHVPSELVSVPLVNDPGGMLSRVRNTEPDIWIRMVYRETFLSIPLHILRHHFLTCSIQGMFLLRDFVWKAMVRAWDPGDGGPAGVTHAGCKDELTSCRGTSSRRDKNSSS